MAIEHAAPSRRTLIHATVLVVCLALLAYQLRTVDFVGLFSDVRVAWVLAALAAFVVSLAAAAHNITAFAPLRLRARDTVRAQLAIGGLRIIAPSAVSTPAVGIRFLHRKGLGLPTATAVLAVAQAAQLLATVVVVGGLALVASTRLPAPTGTVIAVVALLLGVLAVSLLAARRFAAVRRGLADAVEAIRSVGTHLRKQPLRVATGLGASATLTAAHVTAFVCCVHAVGGHGSVLAFTAVYLGAASAGSLVPTPGGIGAVESAMIAGLVATGLTAQVATAAALLSRLVTVWVPAVPGLIALRALRRDGAL
jgi:glycosyltransferase 2 family protein